MIKHYHAPTIQLYQLYEMMLNSAHCIVSGTTGSGKSTVLEALLYSITAYAPIRKKYAIIDLKRVSLIDWKNTPHCIGYATQPEKALELIQSMVDLMESRFIEMESRNEKLYSKNEDIYLFIDESADLLDTVPEAMPLLKKLGRLARSTKIHLIYATQSPDKKTIPAQLQQNLPFRLGLRCTSAIESRQIINASGCEKLPRYGRGLVSCPEFMSIVSAKVDMIPQDEMERVRSWWNDPSHITYE